MSLEKAINARIVKKMQKLEKKNKKVYELLKESIWKEYLERNKQRWSYTDWYQKLIEKYATPEDGK